MGKDMKYEEKSIGGEFNSIAAKAAAFAANNPQLQGKAQFGSPATETPSIGDPNDPSTWAIQGASSGGLQRESRSEYIANRQLSASSKRSGPG